MKEQEREPFVRWFLNNFLTTDHFRNAITMTLVMVYAVQVVRGAPIDDHFFMLLGLVLGAYFKDKYDSLKGNKDEQPGTM